MACIVYQTDKKTGIKYAYESVSYWDKEKKQPRSKRKYIGKVDPVTGEIIRTGEKQAVSPDAAAVIEALRSQIIEKDMQIDALRKELSSANRKCARLEKTVTKIAALVETETEG